MKSALLVLLLVIAAFALWVRLAPFDVARWHVDPEAAPDPGIGGYRATIDTALPPERALQLFQQIAQETPRTRLLAGSAEEGRLSFVTRSRLWGFPDVTTVSARPRGEGGSRITILARLRFGKGDMGVNRARVVDWLTRFDAMSAQG